MGAFETIELALRLRDEATSKLEKQRLVWLKLKLAASAVVGAFAAFIAQGVRFNKQVEKATIQFGAFFRNAEQAEAHVRSLTDFAARTPFQLPGILQASRMLLTFAADAAFGADTLRIVGDAAAGVSAPIEEVSTWFGRMYTAIQAGRPMGEALQRLQELGLLSGVARTKMEDLSKAGADQEVIMGILRDEWEKHNGAMERLSGTTEGLESTFTDLVAQVAGATAAMIGADTAYKKFLETSNQVLTGTLDMMNGVRDLDAEIALLKQDIAAVNPDFGGPWTLDNLARLEAELADLQNLRFWEQYNADLEAAASSAEDVVPVVVELTAEEKKLAETAAEAAEESRVLAAILDARLSSSMERVQASARAAGSGIGAIQLPTAELVGVLESRPLEGVDLLGIGAGAERATRQLQAAGEKGGEQMAAAIEGKLGLALAQIAGNIGGPLGEALNTFRVALNATGEDGNRQFTNMQAGVLGVGSAMSQSNNIFVSTLGNSLSALAQGDWVGAAIAAATGFFTWFSGQFTEGQRAFNDWSDALIAGFGDLDSGALTAAESIDKAVNWEGNEKGFEYLREAQRLWESAGLGAEEATAWTAAWNKAVDEQNSAAMTALLEQREAVGKLARAQEEAIELWNRSSDAAVSAFYKAEEAGTSAYDEVYLAACESGAGQEQAIAKATAASLDATAKVLAAEGIKYARIAAFDAAMALGAHATQGERAEAARLAADAATGSWDAAMDAVVASDQAASDAITGNAVDTTDAGVYELKRLEAEAENEFAKMAAAADEDTLAIQASINAIEGKSVTISVSHHTTYTSSGSSGEPGGKEGEGKAAGGPVIGGTSYIVGERGPELFTPRSSGGITANRDIIDYDKLAAAIAANPPVIAPDQVAAASLRESPAERAWRGWQ